MKNSEQPINPCVIQKADYDSFNNIQLNGLTKREYFAAMAMQGILSNSSYVDALNKISTGNKTLGILVSQEALQFADDILLELEKPQL